MTDRPMTNNELREALAIAENNIKSLKADSVHNCVHSNHRDIQQTKQPR